MTKVSIIVPVYNSSQYLTKCLDSLFSQTLKDIEIICVNDGSTDNSLDILNSYQDDRLKIFSKENGGQASARNLGVSKAVGDYILFVDSDDYIDKDACEVLYDTAVTNDCDILVCDYYINKNNSDKYKKVLGDKKTGFLELKDYLFSDMCPWNKFYKKDLLINNNFKFAEGIIYEDYASIPTLIKYINNVYYLNRAFLHYVQTTSSTVRSMEYKEKYEDIFKATYILYNELKDSPYKDELEHLITCHLLYFGSLNFYKYNKIDQIDKISIFMHEKYPNYQKNKYINIFSLKEKLIMYLFYNKHYGMIKFVQQLKGR